jgi:hypothetical protein
MRQRVSTGLAIGIGVLAVLLSAAFALLQSLP